MFRTSARTRNLLLAGILAVAAAALTALALNRARGGTAVAAPRPTTSVLVATRDLSVGTSLAGALASGAVAPRQVDTQSIESGALTSASAARADVVLQPIYRGEQIVSRRLGASGTGGLPSQLSGRLRVLQVAGDADQLLAATLHAGDHVDVVASVKTGPNSTPYSEVVLRDLLVLQAPQSEGSSSLGGQSLTATVQLTDRQAQRLFYVMRNGDWSFLLRPSTKVTDTRMGPESASSVLEGS
jgi:Flp pilus assembly protein CpaB